MSDGPAFRTNYHKTTWGQPTKSTLFISQNGRTDSLASRTEWPRQFALGPPFPTRMGNSRPHSLDFYKYTNRVEGEGELDENQRRSNCKFPICGGLLNTAKTWPFSQVSTWLVGRAPGRGRPDPTCSPHLRT